MARFNQRRSRRADTGDDDDLSREPTPASTAPGDRKRMRTSTEATSDGPTSALDVRSRKSAAPDHDESLPVNDSATPTRTQHQPGAILRIKLTNFVTYTSAEFFPGPNLNMVIGPNGTGKSTLVCAICLGLGWGPGLLGRAKDPAEFVKHGAKEATIEIELQRSTKPPNRTERNPIIVRKIKKDDNKSSFWVNEKSTSSKHVQEVARAFNIQVDNLCQFLPQDRVVEFAQLNPVQMLETTLRAAAGAEVLETHQQLKTVRERQQEWLYDTKGDRESLENLQKRQEAQRMDVERLRERQIVQERIDWLHKCEPIPKYHVAKVRAQDLKRLKRKLNEETTQLRQESEPSLRQVNAKQRYAVAAEQNRKNASKDVDRANKECQRLDRQIVSYAEQMADCDARIKGERNGTTADKQQIGRHIRELNGLKQQKAHEPEDFDPRAMNAQISEYTATVRELSQKIEELDIEARSWRKKGQDYSARQKALKDRLETMNTQEGQRESKLEDLVSKDTHRAWQWIKNNQQRFRKEVLGPPAVTCTVKDPRMAKPLEALVQQSDMRIITAQCREDFRLLQEELTKNQRLHDISIRTCGLTDLSTFQTPFSDEKLHELGLEHWALDCLEGPAPVLAMLCQEKKLHQTAIAGGEVTQTQHDAISNSPLSSYIAGGKSYRFTRRKEYGSAGITAQIRDIRPARIWTDQPVDTGRQQELHQQIRELSREKHEAAEGIAALEQEANALKEQMKEGQQAKDQLQTEKDEKQRAKMAWKGLDTKIEQLQDKIVRLEEKVASTRDRVLNVEKEKDDAMFQKAEAVLAYCEATHSLKEAHAKLLEAEIMNIEAQSDYTILREINQHIKETLERKETELLTALKDHEEANNLAGTLLKAVKALLKQGEDLQEETGETGFLDLMKELAQTEGLSEQHLEDRLDVEHAKLELNAGGTDAAHTIREFEDRARKIDKLQDKLKNFSERQLEYIESIKSLREDFEGELYPIINQIDAAFAESFARIGCAGQVAVHRASSTDPADCTEELGGQDNGLDFANWAIHISVKFRESEPLQLLDSHRQSGGERAVSTIFYLMALQSLSKSPFRVVDEINQGMDPRNERMVHGGMVDIAAANEKAVAETGSGGSQYFLITPKLLSGLKYERGMTVLCIVSGENMPSASDVRRRDADGNSYIEKSKKVDFAAFAKRARELGIGTSAGNDVGGRRIDSGVSLQRSVPVTG